MSVSSFSGSSAAAGAGSFTITVSATGNTNYTLASNHAAGNYNISFLTPDTNYDVYFINKLGVNVGYTNSTPSIIATGPFNKVAIMGLVSANSLSFNYTGENGGANGSFDSGAGATITAVNPSSLPHLNDTTVVTGTNFATNVAVNFLGTDAVTRAAKSVVRSNASSLIVTRPDAMPPEAAPYDVIVNNPGVPVPAATSSHILADSITVGARPVWTSGDTLPYYTVGTYYATQLTTNETEGPVVFSIASGALPTGLSLNGTTGVISGTPTVGGSSAVTFRATDDGGNYADKLIYVTTQVTISGGTLTSDATYYYRTFTSSGTLQFDKVAITADFLVVAGGGGGGQGGYNGGTGGGGGGGFLTGSATLQPTSHAITVGAGGVGGSSATNGSNSSLTTILVAIGGGRGGRSGPEAGADGGSGGGGTTGNYDPRNGGLGVVGQGNNGGNADGNWCGGGGGGAGSAGGNGVSSTRGGSAGSGKAWQIGGVNVINGTLYAAGAPGGSAWGPGPGSTAQPQAANSATGGYYGGNAGSGIVIMRYKKSAIGE